MTLRELPTLAPALAGETLQAFGVRVLIFVLVHRVTATLTDTELELADHVYPFAIARPDIDAHIVDQLSDVRHQILSALRVRRAIEAPIVTVPATPDTKPNIGPMARLQDAPIVRPPSPVAIQF